MKRLMSMLPMCFLAVSLTNASTERPSNTQTPIKHLVVIFDENISFDHYFGTYPNAEPNLDGSAYFGAPKKGTPEINGYTPTYLKFSSNETGHPADSTPLLEQTSIVTAVNAIQQSPFWKDTAIIIGYDDSGGWYDHAAPQIINQSTDGSNDAIFGNPALGTGSCASPGTALPSGAPNDRCGFGVRLPFLVISPFAKQNYVGHGLNDITSVLRFIEYNWNLGTIGDPQSFDVLASGSILDLFDFQRKDDSKPRKLILDPSTGKPVNRPDE